MKRFLATTLAAAAMASPAFAESFDVTFITHVDAGLPELDVYLASVNDDDLAIQIRPGETKGKSDQMLFAAATPIPHNPFDPEAGGPFPKGEPLGLTLGDWLGARGVATVSCDGETGRVTARFEGLVPDAVYTAWYALVPMPPTIPFTGALDLPLGARDGSNSMFTSDAEGSAQIDVTFAPCLELSNEQVLAVLALAWHSDGTTYGSSPGAFGLNSHVQIFAPLPKKPKPES